MPGSKSLVTTGLVNSLNKRRAQTRWKVRNVDVLPCFLENGVAEGVLRSVDRLGRGHE